MYNNIISVTIDFTSHDNILYTRINNNKTTLFSSLSSRASFSSSSSLVFGVGKVGSAIPVRTHPLTFRARFQRRHNDRSILGRGLQLWSLRCRHRSVRNRRCGAGPTIVVVVVVIMVIIADRTTSDRVWQQNHVFRGLGNGFVIRAFAKGFAIAVRIGFRRLFLIAFRRFRKGFVRKYQVVRTVIIVRMRRRR